MVTFRPNPQQSQAYVHADLSTWKDLQQPCCIHKK